MITKFNLSVFDLVDALIEENFHFVYNPHKEAIEVLSYGELDLYRYDILEELAEEFGLKIDEIEFRISKELQEEWNADRGYGYIFS